MSSAQRSRDERESSRGDASSVSSREYVGEQATYLMSEEIKLLFPTPSSPTMQTRTSLIPSQTREGASLADGERRRVEKKRGEAMCECVAE